jgi:hypothetical protein
MTEYEPVSLEWHTRVFGCGDLSGVGRSHHHGDGPSGKCVYPLVGEGWGGFNRAGQPRVICLVAKGICVSWLV